ncbi:hypothetical protein Bbelb_388600 [Branchiostoma belcheri]|nr:hypothetical protein Bbelb_388600 [Branchiostoma belcheri]
MDPDPCQFVGAIRVGVVRRYNVVFDSYEHVVIVGKDLVTANRGVQPSLGANDDVWLHSIAKHMHFRNLVADRLKIDNKGPDWFGVGAVARWRSNALSDRRGCGYWRSDRSCWTRTVGVVPDIAGITADGFPAVNLFPPDSLMAYAAGLGYFMQCQGNGTNTGATPVGACRLDPPTGRR